MSESSDRSLDQKFWNSEPVGFTLETNTVHVWLAPFKSELLSVAPVNCFLSDLEFSRAEHYRFQKDRNLFIFARGTLRLLLSHYLNLRPGEISITNSPSGKPFVKQHLQAPPFCFNLSHAGNLVVYAFTLGNEIGIDLECIYPIADLEALIERYYSKNEKDLLRVASSENRHRLFLQYWVRKEAYIKARGAGLALIGSDLDVSAIPVPALALTPFQPNSNP